MRREKAHKKPATTPRRSITPLVLDAAVVVLAIAVFWPLVRYFFAQDDFVLLERASRGFGESVGTFFEARPGQFRPLTKGLYFLVTWPLFGLNAAPFHVLSILMHAANAVLVGVLLRRMGVSAAASRFAAVLFAVNVGYLEAVAWASCVQQLVGNAFMLLSLVFGIDALERGGRRPRAVSALALVLALASYEQTLAAPAVLFGWHALRNGPRALAGALKRLPEQPLILAAYLVFTLAIRGVPDSGPYVMSVGPHVLDNLRQYTGLVYALWVVFPAYGLPAGFTASHAALVAVAAFLVFRRRFREVAFGLGTFAALLAPVLFVKEHTHSFHLYVPAIGIWFLAALALDELLGRLPLKAKRTVPAALLVLAGFAGLVSGVAVRENVAATISDDVTLPRSFVLRRAVLAQAVCDGIRTRSRLRGRAGRLVLVYRQPQYRANWLNVHAALGQGSAVRLALESPGLDVVFVPPEEARVLEEAGIEVLVYTELGRVYTAEEAMAAGRRAAPGGAPADTTTAGPPER